MQIVQLLPAILAVSQLSIAAPTEQRFTVHQKRAGTRQLSAAAAIEATLLKYNTPVPAFIKEAAAKQKGTVVATPAAFDEAYYCPVEIGTPAQTLSLDFDTGSSDLWVFSSEQPTSQTTNHTIYTPGKSSTSSLLQGETWQIGYADGSGASGNIYADKVVIGGVTATSQAVECATSASSSFVQGPGDGLVGLAYPSDNTAEPNKVSPFVYTVQSTLKKPLFAAYLRKGEPGSYDFGFINKTKYTGSIAYAPVNSTQGFWQFDSAGYAIGSSKKLVKSAMSLITDTGTSIALLPTQVVKAYYKQVKGARKVQGLYVMPCTGDLPDFSIEVSGQLRTLPGSYVPYQPLNKRLCLGGIQSGSSLGLPYNILGDTFLKSQYVIFDVGNNQVGFANQATQV